MAEFQEVMRQYYRMCNGYICASSCPMKDHETQFCESMGRIATDMGAEKVERIILDWAAEHPEPVYPTWVEWLRQIGVVPSEQKCFHSWLFDHIPADIAEKLGLQPKEG